MKSGKSRFLPETSGFCPLTTVWMFRGKTRHLYTLCVLSKIDTPYPLVKYTNCGYIYSSQIRFLMLSMDSAKSGSAIIDLILVQAESAVVWSSRSNKIAMRLYGRLSSV